MRNVLADLAVESEAATTAMMRLAGANDRAVHGDAGEAALRRLALAATKYYVCKRGPVLANEALECLGGNGYIEDFDLARIYREYAAPLDLGGLRQRRRPRRPARDRPRAGVPRRLLRRGRPRPRRRRPVRRRGHRAQEGDSPTSTTSSLRARRLVEQIAVVFQAGLLLRNAPTAVADAFCASRLARDWGSAFGTLPAGLDLAPILERTEPGF
ncbi:acyl-CoA dehydrogenase family protein [Nocardioides convexus]|uniref:acyl-CoA dehydrogenase family protein n=1 Tax=Nocardioides convexus TaxID=2712224 RepID=UPI0024186E93|nr:acyl-CoA dehydrogenase family protein [Nocardioides convexus]